MPEHFVRDGGERLRAAVAAAVREEFAERLANASLLERVRLQVAIRREVDRRLATVAPESLY